MYLLFFLPNVETKKMPFLYSGRGDETLEKLDTLKYTNIQFKDSIQSVWTTNADWKSFVLCSHVASLPSSAITWSDAANAVHMPRILENEM